MANDFFAYLSKMRYINRWALMRNSMNENLSEHSLETAYISHALAIISNKRLGNNVDISRVVLRAIYHDCSEILTGDLPTPVKYNNPEIKKAYKDLEKLANRKLLKLLPDDMREEYEEYFEESTDEKEEELVWAADKLSAVIKCLQEENADTIRKMKVSDMNRRLDIMENSNADLFLSIHMNSFGDARYSGLHTYYSENGNSSYELAGAIQDAVKVKLQPNNNRVIKAGRGMYVLENVKNTAVLIECGFLSNPDECEKLSQKEYQRELCFSILCGIIEYTENKA